MTRHRWFPRGVFLPNADKPTTPRVWDHTLTLLGEIEECLQEVARGPERRPE